MSRKNASRAVFIVTDNSHIGPKGTSPKWAAEKLKKLNVPIFAVGIGTALSLSELGKVASRKDNAFVIKDLSTVPHADFTRMVVGKACRKIENAQRPSSGFPLDQSSLLDMKQLMTALSNLNKVWDQLSTGKLTTSSCRLTRDAEAALELALNGKTRDRSEILQRSLELNATSFVDLVYALGMAEEFTHDAFTVFLPTNEAFTSLHPRDKLRLKDQCFLKKLLRHHVARGAKSVGSLRDGDTLYTIGNEKLAISDFGDVKRVNGFQISSGDHDAGKSVIHLINSLLLGGSRSLYNTIKAYPELKTFERYLCRSCLEKYITESGQVTVFAPTNAAISALAEDVRNKLGLDHIALKNFLLQHMHKGTILTTDLQDGLEYAVRPLKGKTLRMIKTSSADVTLNGDSRLVVKDIIASDGVLHIISKVILV